MSITAQDSNLNLVSSMSKKRQLWVGFHQANRGIKLRQSYHVQIPPETKYEVVNVLSDKSASRPQTEVVMNERKSKAMVWIKLEKQGFSQTSPKASMIIITNWQNAWEICKESFLWISDSRKTFHIHELDINDIRSQSPHYAEMFFNSLDTNCYAKAFSGEEN